MIPGLFLDRRWLSLADRPQARALFAGASSLVLARPDGLVTDADLRVLASSVRLARRAARELVTVGLFVEREGGFALAPEFLTPVSPAATPTASSGNAAAPASGVRLRLVKGGAT